MMEDTIDICRSGGGFRLNLSNLGLTELPKDVFEFAETLELLNLGGNALSDLPSDFVLFKKLRILFFAGNKFEKVPIVLGSMPSLYMLSFKGNCISQVPEESLSPSVGWLILSDNNISSLPCSIGALRGLRKCMLAGNKLRDLPDEMRNCRELELLRLSANNFEVIPEWLFSLPKLSWLACAGNPCLPSPPEPAVDLVQLEELSIGEKLGEGASGIVYEANIKELALDGGEMENRRVAVKLFKGVATSDGLPEDEVKVSLHVGMHPNITSVLAKVQGSKSPGLIFPLIPKEFKTLGGPPNFDTVTRDTFSEDANFSVDFVWQVATGVASACAHLHARGICHGDIYAHNILTNVKGEIILGDFGASTFYGSLAPDGGSSDRATDSGGNNDSNSSSSSRSSDGRSGFEALEVCAFGHLLDDLLVRMAPPVIGADGSDLRLRKRKCLQQLRDLCRATRPELRPTLAAVSNHLASAPQLGISDGDVEEEWEGDASFESLGYMQASEALPVKPWWVPDATTGTGLIVVGVVALVAMIIRRARQQ
jgi:hypothetical protein